ncbi:hypothetical protein H4W80_003185 [Nonomuraea angiospora]|uniref:Uncharacterized protein n=1 Tax=Nonomuraea angiospora TaxID=46172 RepID=A0ABR9LWA0_9ACTN|nr:hypothetical protein [Nonomuraea angiospora]
MWRELGTQTARAAIGNVVWWALTRLGRGGGIGSTRSVPLIAGGERLGRVVFPDKVVQPPTVPPRRAMNVVVPGRMARAVGVARLLREHHWLRDIEGELPHERPHGDGPAGRQFGFEASWRRSG